MTFETFLNKFVAFDLHENARIELEYLFKNVNMELYNGMVVPTYINYMASFQDTIQVIRTLIKNPDVLRSIVQVVKQIHKSQKQRILPQHINEVKTEFAQMMSFGHQYRNTSPFSVGVKICV